MTNEATPPVRYKQSKRKPLGVLLTSLLPLIISLVFLVINIISLVDEITESESDPPSMVMLYVIIGVFIAIPIVTYIMAYCVWRSDGFCILDDGISYDFSFIIKRYIKLPYDKINTVKIKRSLFNIILGLSVVQIGSGSGLTSGVPEISLYFSKNYAEYFMNYIQKRASAAKQNTALEEEFVPPPTKEDKTAKIVRTAESYSVAFADKMRLIFTNGLFYLGILFSCISPITAYFAQTDDTLSLTAAIVTSCVLNLLIIFGTIAFTAIRYYDYKIYEQDGCINISYGLITKQSFSVSRGKIRGYEIKQGLLQQILRVGSLRLNVIGINTPGSNGTQNITYLYPCAKLNKLNELIAKYVPEFKYDEEITAADKHAHLHNFAIPAFWFTLLVLPSLLILSLSISFYCILPIPAILLIMFIHCLLLKRNSKFGVSEKFLYAQIGGLIKRTLILRTDAVQEITSYAGTIRKKQNIATYRVVYRGDNALSGSIFFVRNLPCAKLDKFN